MRKSSFFMILSMLFFSLVSCNQEKEVQNDDESEKGDHKLSLDDENDDELDLIVDSDVDYYFDDSDHDSESDCTCDTVEGDIDGDGIPNTIEGCLDHNGNGIPNCMDPDSDGDGINDKRECITQPCPDTDGDGTPDYLDRDSDSDNLTDKHEIDEGTNPYCPDTDGDGTTDGVEVFIGTDPLDKESRPPDGIYYAILDYYGKNEEKILIDFTTSRSKLDIVTMIDVTGSMLPPFEKIKEQVAYVINEDLQETNNNEDFFAFGIVEAPYNVILPVTSDKSVFNDSLSKVSVPYGGYAILLETIYQSVMGDGFSSKIGFLFGASGVHEEQDVIFPPKKCEGETGNTGGSCFRKDTSHLLVLFTDDMIYEIPPENEVKFTQYYDDVWLEGEQPGHSMKETLVAMSSNDVKILVVNTAFECDNDGNNCTIDNYANDSHDYISEMTGTTDIYGNSLNFHTADREGNGIRENLAGAIKTLTEYVEKDITLRFEGSYFDQRSEHYTTDVIQSFRPFKADPDENIEKMDDIYFYKVKQDTKITFELTLAIEEYLPGDAGTHSGEFTVQFVSNDQILGIRIVRFFYSVGE